MMISQSLKEFHEERWWTSVTRTSIVGKNVRDQLRWQEGVRGATTIGRDLQLHLQGVVRGVTIDQDLQSRWQGVVREVTIGQDLKEFHAEIPGPELLLVNQKKDL